MKTRNGFISNSSSSSFVIGLDKKPDSVDELEKILYPRDKHGNRRGVSNSYGDGDISASDAAHLIWDQIKDQKPLNKAQILEEILGGLFPGYPKYNFDTESSRIRQEYRTLSGKDVYDEDADKAWYKKYVKALDAEQEQFQQDTKDAAIRCLNKEYPRLKNKKCYVVSFSDNDGETGAIMEHGDTFRSVPHLTISHH